LAGAELDRRVIHGKAATPRMAWIGFTPPPPQRFTELRSQRLHELRDPIERPNASVNERAPWRETPPAADGVIAHR
jgi:hypothetical protein